MKTTLAGVLLVGAIASVESSSLRGLVATQTPEPPQQCGCAIAEDGTCSKQVNYGGFITSRPFYDCSLCCGDTQYNHEVYLATPDHSTLYKSDFHYHHTNGDGWVGKFLSFTEPNMDMADPYYRWKVVAANGQNGCIRVGDPVRIENRGVYGKHPGVNRLFTGVGVNVRIKGLGIIKPFADFMPLDPAIAPLALGVAQADSLTFQDVFTVFSTVGLPSGYCISSNTPIILQSTVHPEVRLHTLIQLTHADYDSLAGIDPNSLEAKWVEVAAYNGDFKYTLTTGVTASHSKTLSSSETKTLTHTVHTAFSAGGAKSIFHASVDYTFSQSVADTISTSLTQSVAMTTTRTQEYNCDGTLYQFVATAGNQDAYTIMPAILFCTKSNLAPQCPLKSCKDQNCQTCCISENQYVACD